jgi:hypothetical protein
VRRAQVQLDETTYDTLKRRASERGLSVSAYLRELLRDDLAGNRSAQRFEDFTFIGSGESEQGALSPVSERHDEALAEDLAS